MALERLQSIFNNIEDNKQSLEDGYPVESISNSVDDNIHSFGTQGNRTELISITKINKRQDPSPLMAIKGIFVEDAKGNLSQTPINPVNGHNFGQIRINDNAGTNLLKTVSNEHGFGTVVESTYDVNTTDLGKGDFVFGSLFAHNHAKPVNRPPAKFSPNSLRSDLQLYVEPENKGNLNIKSHDTLSRRGAFGIINEPYITHNIPKSGDKTKFGYNRDGFPNRARAEDISRLGAYYTSPKGLLKLAAENITNIAIGDGITLAEPFGGLLLPAFPIPMTGFLNDYQQAKQGKFQGIEFPDKIKAALKKGIGGKGFELKDIPGGNTVSIRKPGVREYSELAAGEMGSSFLGIDIAGGISTTGMVLAIQGDISFGGNRTAEGMPGIDVSPLDKLYDTVRETKRKEKLVVDIELTKAEKAKVGLGNLGKSLYNLKEKGLTQLDKIKVKAQNALVDEAKKQLKKLTMLPPMALPTKRFLGLNKGIGSHSKFGPEDYLSLDGVVEATDDYGHEAPLEALDDVDKGDFYVRIRDMRGLQNEYIYFRGFVTGITENLTPTWNPTTYIGRSEDVWIYQKGERDISFNLRVAPANAEAMAGTYARINKLTSMVYPNYIANRMQPPFTELFMAHIGHKTKGQFGYIKSLTYTVNEQGDWDALTLRPRVFDIAISYQILHKRPPNMVSTFYMEKRKAV